MILHGMKKRVLKEVIRYYVETTERAYEDFILEVQRTRAMITPNMPYSEWLAVQCFKLLENNGITLEDCVENKDTIRSAIKEDESRMGGEFYTPEVWCADGREYLKRMLGDQWGKAYIWDASCYTMDTDLFTDRGWLSYDELKDTDKVFALNPETLETEYVGFHSRFVESASTFLELHVIRKAYFAGYGWEDCVDLKVTLNHKMCARINGVMTLLSAEELYARLEKAFFVPEGKVAEKIEIPVYTKDYENYHPEEIVRFVGITLEDARITVQSEAEPVWDITLDRYHVFLVRRGGAVSFCGNCGTGNLLATSGYPVEKIFMSSLLPEDVEMVKTRLPGVNAFQCDFVNDIDFDENNKFFSNKLPPELVGVLERNEPIVFYMNPPYKVMEAKSSDVGSYMSNIGMTKCALDIFHQFMFRMVMIKRFYSLTNVYMGIFGPVTMFHSKMIEPLYEEFKREFKFFDGMCFDAGDFANTSESVGWIVGYTTWRTKQEGEEDKSIVLDAKLTDPDGNIKVIGKRLITSIDKNLHEWVKAKDIYRKDEILPSVTTFSNFTGQTMKTPEGVLGYMMSSNFVIRATRRACVTSLPNPDDIAITPENFARAVASFTARRCYASKTNPYNNCQYYSMPDTSVEGYQAWLNDALIVFLFDYSAHQSAYRGVEVDGRVWDTPNRMFPIPLETIRQVVTDPVLLEDIEKHPAQNSFILEVLQQVYPHLGPEAKEAYEFCLQLMLESLTGTRRADAKYDRWTNAWDAGITQIRSAKGLVPSAQEERYAYLMSKLKHKLLDGVYKYGFMMDTAFAVEDDLTGESLEDVEDVEDVDTQEVIVNA